jgi:hypothetical protein
MGVAMKHALLKWINLISFVIVVTMNTIVGATSLIGGKTTAQVSDAYPTLVTPAGYVFTIWSVIYILLGVFVIVQALSRGRAEVFRERIGLLFTMSCVFNIVWLFLWQFELLLASVIVMFMFLATLILIYLRLGIGKSAVGFWEKIVFHLPFSVYLGWITIASIANVAVLLVSLNWNGFGISQETWAVVIIIIALLIASLVVLTRKDVAYGLVVIWALLGIAVKQSMYPTVVVAAQVSVIVIGVIIMVVALYSKLKSRSIG